MGECPGCGRDLPEAGYAFCPWCGVSVVAPSLGQLKTVTVLLADLVDSTRLGAALDPEVLGSVVSLYRDASRSAVERHGGRVAKFIGDAAVGVFGIPASREDDAMRAVRAAADLRRELDLLNVDLDARLGIRLATRMGVNTGLVMVDGADDDVSLLAGDFANVCARLEQAADPGDILLGEATFTLVRGGVVAHSVLPIMAKGKDDPLTAYRVVSVGGVSDAKQRPGFVTKMIDRDHELAVAFSAYDATVDGSKCALLTVIGAPGVGKSRMVEELVSHVGSGTQVLEGRCLPYGDGITYWPLVQMLHPLLTPEFPSWSDRVGDLDHGREIVQGLESILGAHSPVSGDQMSWAFRRLVETLASDTPVMLILDDLQWAEPALLDLVQHLVHMARDVPIFVVCMARPELMATSPDWASTWPSATAIELPELSSSSSARLVEQLLGGEVDPGVLSRIVDAAGGVPLFLEEIVASLVENGSVQVGPDGRWSSVRDLADLQIPPSVLALVSARLDRLPTSARRVIESAAVMGQTFYPDALVAMGNADVDVSANLDVIARANFVGPSVTDVVGHDAYSFGHLLIRDAAYDAIPKARRAVLHQAYAAWLDSTSIGGLAPELAASHLERAASYRSELGHRDVGLSEAAALRLVACAGRSRLSGDFSSARAQLAAAARLVDRESTVGLNVMLERVDVAMRTGDATGALELANTAESLAADAMNAPAMWHARVLSLWISLNTDPNANFDLMSRQLAEAVTALEGMEADGALAMAHFVSCALQWAVGQVDEVGSSARRGLAAAKRSGDLTLVARLLEMLMLASWFGPATLEEEEAFVEEVLAEFGQEPLLARALATFQVVLAADKGHIDEAVDYATRGVALALEQGSPYVALDLQNLGTTLLRSSGQLSRAEAAQRVALELSEQMDGTSFKSTQLADLSLILAQLGRDDEAREAMAESRSISHPSDMVNEVLFALTEGVLHARLGNRRASERAFDDGLAVLARTQFTTMYIDAWLARSGACQILGDWTAALGFAQEALSLAQSRGRIPPIRLAQQRLAECRAHVLGD